MSATAPLLLRPFAEYVWCAPFWMKAVHFPIPSRDRHSRLQDLVAALRMRSLPDCGIKEWSLLNLQRIPVPWRMSLKLSHIICAHLEPDEAILSHIGSCLEEAGYGRSIRVIPLSSTLYYEDLGMGAVEYRILLRAEDQTDLGAWTAFMHDKNFWTRISFAYLKENRKLKIQNDWHRIRGAFQSAIDHAFGERFGRLEEFLAWQRRDPSLTRHGTHRGQQAEASKQDDLLWCYCMDVILFRNPEFLMTTDSARQATEVVHRIGTTLDYRHEARSPSRDQDRIWTGYATTQLFLLALGDDLEDSLDAIYSGFTTVTLILEGARSAEADVLHNDPALYKTLSARVAALRRRMLVNYGAITEAADALRAFISTLFFTSSESIFDRHDLLRVIIATLAMIKYDSRREVVETDDFETYVYGAFQDAWGVEGQMATLTALTEDADKATSRISEAATHTEERQFNLLILILTIVTLGGVASEVAEFIEETSGQREFSKLNLLLLVSVWAFALTAALLFRRRLHSRRRH